MTSFTTVRSCFPVVCTEALDLPLQRCGQHKACFWRGVLWCVTKEQCAMMCHPDLRLVCNESLAHKMHVLLPCRCDRGG